MFTCFAVMLFVISTANAQPPQSCAKKFIGTWGWMSSTGIQTISDFRADGNAVCTGNAFCSSGTWTCNGNRLIYNNGMSDTVLTLSADGSKMTGTGGMPNNLQTVVWIGSVSASAKTKQDMQAQAEVLTYSCSEPDDPTGAEIIRVHTKTHMVILTDPDTQPQRGTAQINGDTITVGGFPAVNGRTAGSWSMTINRSTGASLDSDGSSGTCQLVR